MKIAIVTFHKAPSCGAQLQAWALKTVIERLGHHVVFPLKGNIGVFKGRWPYRRPSQEGFLRSLRGKWKDFLDNVLSVGIFVPTMASYEDIRKRFFEESSVLPSESSHEYDMIVYGSDQVWNVSLTKDDAAYYLGENVAPGIRKIAYAVSIGDGIPDETSRHRIFTASRQFERISLRERKVADYLSPLESGSYSVVLDPSLLLRKEDYHILANKKRNRKDRYLYYYALYHNQFAYERVRSLAESMGLHLLYTPLYQYTRRHMPKGTVYGVTPPDFLAYMEGATCVVTDSFHGTAFAIQNRVPFITYQLVEGNVESRPSALLGAIGLGDRLVGLNAPFERMRTALVTPLSDEALRKLDNLRDYSLGWLKEAINAK